MSTTERLEFAPPRTPGLLRSLALAILAHAVLVAVLTVGVAWKREVATATVEAELWSAVPQEAAPPAPEPVPEPPQPPQPVQEVKPEPAPPPPVKAEADIALAKEKARKEKEKEREKQLALEKLEREKKEAKQRELDKQKQAKLEQEKKDKLAKEKAQKEAAQAKQEEQRREEARKQQLERMAKLAGGGSGSASSTGSAAQSSGPSAGYMGRIVGRIKPNIVFTESVAGNPRAEVEIRVSPTGTILSAKVSQSSGVKAWDDAVVRAIEKTEVLPKDVDGTIPTSMTIGFRPKD